MKRALAGWFDSLRVRSKLGAVFSMTLALLTVGGGVLLLMLGEIHEARGRSEATHQGIQAVEALRESAIEQQSGLRGYILTAQPAFLEPYRSGSVTFESSGAQLQVLMADNVSQQQRLARVLALMNEWQSEVAVPAIAWMEQPETRQRAVDGVVSGAGKRRIDGVRRLCDEMIAEERRELAARDGRVARLARTIAWTIVGLLGAGWVAVMYGVALIDRALGVPLTHLAQLVPRLAAGEAVDVPHRERHDEVGVLADAFEHLRDTSAEQRRRDWVAERAAALVAALQHSDSEAAFGEVLLARLADALDAGYALAYRWNERLALLEWCAAYGLPDPSATRRRFKLGEGLVGQCMVERRMLEVAPVPDGYLRVVSGLGAALPQAVLFVPVTARGETVAVLELGLLQAPQRMHRELLGQVLVSTGLAWQSLSRSLRTRELLDESQALTEELQSQQEALRVQQEELRAVNETLRGRSELLEDHGRRLEASQEELRSQAEELRITNTALEEKTSALQQRQAELEAARAELERRAADLERASRYKSEFLANMSHELRTPLNSMLILSKMLAENADGNLDAEQVESARIVHDSGKSLLNLINDILDLSKVEAGKMGLTLEDVDVADCLRALVERFQPLASERGLSFAWRLAPGTLTQVCTDGARLAQILSNLLSNAFKFTQQGEVELFAEPTEVADGPGVAFGVRDTGIGIAPDKLERVFQAFEQADSGTSRRYGGTGLGLSIVRGMVGLLGGQVDVRSQEGQGSTFTVRLPDRPRPASAPAPMQKPQASPSPASPGDEVPTVVSLPEPIVPTGTPALLVVEDDAVFARVLADIASRRGLEVLVVGMGREALELARRRRLSGVLLDIGLPDISGWEVLEGLKANPYTARIPVHIVSGNEEALRLGRERGAVGFLHKPVARESILAALESLGGGAPRRRLLLVDHDPAARASVTALLAAEDVEIVEAQTAAEGLQRLEAESFDGLILEPDLPDAPGLQFLAQAAARAPLPPLVIHSQRELTPDENLRLREYTGSIVIRGARSSERLLDEVHLFLHALDRPGPMPAPATPHAPVADLVGKTVLVADDDMRNVFALSKVLRGLGLDVVMAQDGHRALAQLESRADIDLVLMDIMMPGMDGYETIRRIRARPQWAGLPIIAVTAKAMRGDRERCLEVGANDYCAKPIDMERLASLLRVWI